MFAIGAGLLAIALVASLGGCGDDESAGEATADRGAASNRVGTEILAVQNGSGASMRRRDGNTYELTIDRPSPRTLYFTDSPARRARSARVSRLAPWVKRGAASQGYSANVTVSWYEPREMRSLVAELLDIAYESGPDRLRATLEPLSLKPGGAEPTTFSNRSVSLVFDGSEGLRCAATVYGGEDDYWTLESSAAEGDEWDRRPPETINGEAIILSLSPGFFKGCEFSARYGDGAGNGFTVGVDNPFVGSPSYTCKSFGRATCDSESVEHEDGNEAYLQATVGYAG